MLKYCFRWVTPTIGPKCDTPISFPPPFQLIPPAPLQCCLKTARPGTVAPQDQPRQHGETVSTKNTKISWAWWHVPVVPATQEAKAGESLEPGRQDETLSQNEIK